MKTATNFLAGLTVLLTVVFLVAFILIKIGVPAILVQLFVGLVCAAVLIKWVADSSHRAYIERVQEYGIRYDKIFLLNGAGDVLETHLAYSYDVRLNPNGALQFNSLSHDQKIVWCGPYRILDSVYLKDDEMQDFINNECFTQRFADPLVA